MGRKIQVHEVDSAASNVPVKPTTNVNRKAGFLATAQWSLPNSVLAKFGVIQEAPVNGFDPIDTAIRGYADGGPPLKGAFHSW